MIQNILMEKRNLFANQNEEEAIQNRKPQEVTEDIELNIKEEITTRKKEDQGKGVGYTNPQAIKNLMSNFDKDGDLINAHGVAGMDATGIPLEQRHKIINVSEKSRQDMFDETKRHFLQENGVGNGDTTRRSEVFTRYQLRLKVLDKA